MGNGNDSILEAYLFETNSLLEQLDSLVLAAEEKDSFPKRMSTRSSASYTPSRALQP